MLDNLYQDIGEKIKSWAKWVFIVGAIASVIGAIVMMATAEDSWVLIVVVIVLIIGPLVSLVSSWLLYGFGEMLDTLDVIAHNTYQDADNKNEPQDNNPASNTSTAKESLVSKRMRYYSQNQ